MNISKKILFLLSIIFLISGCDDLPTLKKSANNKLVDTKGFQGGKRRPLYNKKYIDRAKHNIIQNDYDDDEYDGDEADEMVDPAARNRYMYQAMLEREKKSKRKKFDTTRKSYSRHMVSPDEYPDIRHARDIANSKENESDKDRELRKELDEIKSMLSSARKDLAKYKCPLQKEKTEEALAEKPKLKPKKAVVNPKPKPATKDDDEEDAEPSIKPSPEQDDAADESLDAKEIAPPVPAPPPPHPEAPAAPAAPVEARQHLPEIHNPESQVHHEHAPAEADHVAPEHVQTAPQQTPEHTAPPIAKPDVAVPEVKHIPHEAAQSHDNTHTKPVAQSSNLSNVITVAPGSMGNIE